jgi:hypothetical protein
VALTRAGHYEQAETVIRWISDPGHQVKLRTDVAVALARAGHYERVEAVIRPIGDPRRQAKALTDVAEALVKEGSTRSAERSAALACSIGPWATAARIVLVLDAKAAAKLLPLLENVQLADRGHQGGVPT